MKQTELDTPLRRRAADRLLLDLLQDDTAHHHHRCLRRAYRNINMLGTLFMAATVSVVVACTPPLRYDSAVGTHGFTATEACSIATQMLAML